MHSFPFWTLVACVLAQRSRSAPQVLGYPCPRGLPLPAAELPFLEPPRRCTQVPAPAPAPLPVTVSIGTHNCFSARPDGSNSSQISSLDNPAWNVVVNDEIP
eukprot:6178179-Pleurochrysis_carterae.AAC.6